MPSISLSLLFTLVASFAHADPPKNWQEILEALALPGSVEALDRKVAEIFRGDSAAVKRFLAQVPPMELMKFSDSRIFPVLLAAGPLEMKSGGEFMTSLPEYEHGRWRNLETACFCAFENRRRVVDAAFLARLDRAIARVAERGEPLPDVLAIELHKSIDRLHRAEGLEAVRLALLRRYTDLVVKSEFENERSPRQILHDLDAKLAQWASSNAFGEKEDLRIPLAQLRARVAAEKGELPPEPLPAVRVTRQRLADDAKMRPMVRLHDDGEKKLTALEFHLPEVYFAATETVAEKTLPIALGAMFARGVWVSFPSIDKDAYRYYGPGELPEKFDAALGDAEVWLKPWARATFAGRVAGPVRREAIDAAVSARLAAEEPKPIAKLSLARRAGLLCRRVIKWFGR